MCPPALCCYQSANGPTITHALEYIVYGYDYTWAPGGPIACLFDYDELTPYREKTQFFSYYIIFLLSTNLSDLRRSSQNYYINLYSNLYKYKLMYIEIDLTLFT